MSPSESLAPRTRESLQTIQDFLGTLVARYRSDEVLTAVRQFPAREAKFRPMPAWVTSALAEAYRTKGIEQLYSHQASTAELVRDGKNVVVVTPTASGKTLCYNLPVLNAVLENPDTRALYLFPTKALAQDQLAELQDLSKRLDDGFGVFTYDGDTPSDARKAIRERGHIVLTNPDMLHTGILPHHTKWMRLFENLRYIVLDELHTYRGVFGSHLANVLRRLKRVAKFYGSDPQFICCSATIANPGELASQLIEKEVEVVEENGAPAGEKLFVFYNPPMVNRNLGIRRSYINEADTSRERDPCPEAADHRVRQFQAAHRSLADLFAAGESSEARPTGTDSRLSWRLSARRTARDRTRFARRPHSGSGRHQRARTWNRRWFARCLCDGRVSGIDCFHLATGRSRGTTYRKFVRGVRRFLGSARSVHRAAS